MELPVCMAKLPTASSFLYKTLDVDEVQILDGSVLEPDVFDVGRTGRDGSSFVSRSGNTALMRHPVAIGIGIEVIEKIIPRDPRWIRDGRRRLLPKGRMSRIFHHQAPFDSFCAEIIAICRGVDCAGERLNGPSMAVGCRSTDLRMGRGTM